MDNVPYNSLDSRQFVALVSDILASEGHTNIRIMDGPGDGGRDVHSHTVRGEKFLTQCKFHTDETLTCTTRDLSELPMALLKMGYTKGLFATNARISPQAKREFLDNYSDYGLDFRDGNVIINNISSNLVLKSLWFEGPSIRLLKNKWVFPFIIRRHEDDLPIAIHKMDKGILPDSKLLLDIVGKKYPDTLIELQSASPTFEAFEPYRAPEPYSAEEGGFPFLIANELIIAAANLHIVSGFSEDFCKSVIQWWSASEKTTEKNSFPC